MIFVIVFNGADCEMLFEAFNSHGRDDHAEQGDEHHSYSDLLTLVTAVCCEREEHRCDVVLAVSPDDTDINYSTENMNAHQCITAQIDVY